MKTNTDKRSNSQEKKTNKNDYLVVSFGKVMVQIPLNALPYLVIALAIICLVIVVFLFTSDPSLASIR